MVVNDECNELRAQTHALERTLEVQTTHTEVARQETASVGSRLLSLQTQHAQMKTQWSAEKAEMEGRVFQALSLQQSTLGTMRKREKDFDQLQSQLARMLKDSQRAQKCCLLVSKPLPRQWNASSTEPTLKDAEVLALQASLASASVRVRYMHDLACASRVVLFCRRRSRVYSARWLPHPLTAIRSLRVSSPQLTLDWSPKSLRSGRSG